MTTTRTYKNITWINIVAPTPEEVRKLIEAYDINVEVSRDLLLPSPKAQIQYYNNDLIYLALHFPVHKHSHRQGSDIQEVDFLIGTDFVATIHYEPFDPIEEFSKYVEVSDVLDVDEVEHAGLFFFEILKHIYGSVRDDASGIADELKDIEPQIFSGKEKDVVRTLSVLNRSLLGFKDCLGIHRDILELLAIYAKNMFGKSFDQVSFVLLNEHSRVLKDVEHIRDTVRELRETNNTLLSTKQNEVMKNIAMISFITFPLSLIVAIFSLEATMSSDSPYEFWTVIALLIVAIACMLYFFKRKQWL